MLVNHKLLNNKLIDFINDSNITSSTQKTEDMLLKRGVMLLLVEAKAPLVLYDNLNEH